MKTTGEDSDEVDEALRLIAEPSGLGADSAWRRIHDIFHPQLRAYARSLAPTPDDADDAMLETWARVFRAAGHGKTPSSGGPFGAYLLRVCRNYLLDRHRASQRHPTKTLMEGEEEQTDLDGVVRPAQRIFLELMEALSAAADAPDISELAEARSALIDRLSPADATLYVLYTTGTEIPAIAVQLEVSREAVDTRLARLRKRLKGLAEALAMYKLYERGDDAV